jgi:hypothetical protein
MRFSRELSVALTSTGEASTEATLPSASKAVEKATMMAVMLGWKVQ